MSSASESGSAANSESELSNPSEQLEGLELKDGWKVGRRIDLRSETTGGRFFSVAYRVQRSDGQAAFLKALDLKSVFTEETEEPLTKRLERLTAVHNFEVELLEKCGQRNLNRVVRALGHGEAKVPGSIFPVPYLIFELAAGGDTHKAIAAARNIDAVWIFQTLHEVALGIGQLHGIGIAHKDLKPSNVLFFPGAGAKLADLGRASFKFGAGPHDDLICACQEHYAPIDQLYGFRSTNWDERHLSADLYHLGGYAYFLFMQVPITPAILYRVPSGFQPNEFGGPLEEVLPFLRHALSDALVALADTAPPVITDQLTETIRMLCEPDPRRRGHPAEHPPAIGFKYIIRRFLSSFDSMRQRVEFSL